MRQTTINYRSKQLGLFYGYVDMSLKLFFWS